MEAHCLTYPRRDPLEQASEHVAKQIRQLAKGREVIAVVHSMGGIVLRYIMKLPNQGESIVVHVPCGLAFSDRGFK